MIGKHVSELPTPSFVVRQGIIDNNLRMATDLAKEMKVQMRPHVKTHKVAELGIMQREAAGELFQGIVASTLPEVQMFADHGFTDITYCIPIVPVRYQSVLAIAKKIDKLRLFIDNQVAAESLQAFGKSNDFVFDILMKVDTGYHRAGTPWDSKATVDLAQFINSCSHLSFGGIYSHSGHAYDARGSKKAQEMAVEEGERLSTVARHIQDKGIAVPVLSVGATPTIMCNKQSWSAATEVHPGNYVFFDLQQVSAGACTVDDIACSVVTSVVGHYRQTNHILVDAGALALSKDLAPPFDGYGRVRGHPELRIIKATQEEAKITCEGEFPFDKFPIGTTLEILPNHSCLTAACFTEYFALDGENKVFKVYNPCRGW